MRSFRQWVQHWLGLDIIGADARMAWGAAREARDREIHIPALPPPPPPFVAVLIEGMQRDSGAVGAVRRVFMGASANVDGVEHVFSFSPNYPMRDVRVIVFCDLSRVDVCGVFAGTLLLNGNVGECPTARIETWELGVLLRVRCMVRK